ncbi:MAG: alkaline phosphatase family protein [Acidimicrobiales bacterium]
MALAAGGGPGMWPGAWPGGPPRLSRRSLLQAGAVAGGGLALGACSSGPSGRTGLAKPAARARNVLPAGTLPHPHLPEGTDTIPEIDHIMVVMLENHSFDNILGMLGRGDGFTLGSNGAPTATNPNGRGQLVRAFHMPTPCQLHGKPSQSWNASHVQYDHGTNEGFVVSKSGPVAMGYWTPPDMPFTNGLAKVFPIGDRYFCSVLGQTFPNRRYLIAGTSIGMVDDTTPSGLPPAGTIFDLLNRHGIPWRDYYSSLPTAGVFLPLLGRKDIAPNLVHINQLYADAASGNLPAFAIVDPNFGTESEEDPQDIQYGDVFLAKVMGALMSGPAWPSTLVVWNYDEHGGYYDHVLPPAAPAPDGIPPAIKVPPDQPGGFDRYGFRVPFGVVSPYARKGYVSHVVHDHTSVLKLVETKWNLPALTRRDANASDLLDSIDLASPPAFLHPPTLPAPANPALEASCEQAGPGLIPPPAAVVRA